MAEHVAQREGLPSRDTPRGGDVRLWSREKAQRDSREGGGGDGQLWMVHGKWYDLSGFVERHPGGPDWLRLTQGQDVTEAYEAHHLNAPKVDAILKTMYVRDASESYVGRYPWDKAGFYPTLQDRVRKVFGTRPDGRPDTGPTREFLVLCSFAIVVHFAAFAATLCWPHWLMAVMLGFTLQTFHGIGHNFLHVADNPWMYCYDFCGWKHHKHRVSHGLSHHLHPNTALDLEFPEPGSFTSTATSHLNSRWVVLVGPLSMWSGPLRDILSLWRGLAAGTEPWRPEYLINMAQLVLLAVAAGPLRGAALFCVMHFTCGFCIETAGFALHRSIFCWSYGDENAKYDFGEHCLAATADHDIDMPLFGSLYLFQILNNHGIHHLFPTIDKSRIHEVMPVFRETCKEFGIPWQEYDWRDMCGSLWKNWVKGLYTDTPNLTQAPRGHALVAGSPLRVSPIPGQTIGAVVTGVKVQGMSDDEFGVIKKALQEHCVLVIRDQELAPAEQLALAKKFPYSRTCDFDKLCGPLARKSDRKEWCKFKLQAQPEIQVRGYGQLVDHYGIKDYFLDTGKKTLEYHVDSLHEYDTPPVITSLYCLASPGSYDATNFIDCHLAYERLSEAERERAETLFAQYKQEPWPVDPSGLKASVSGDASTLGSIYERAVEKNTQEGEGGEQVEVSEVHPLVWTHPATGRKAIVSAAMWLYRLVEADGTPWTPEESHDYVYRLLKPVEQQRYSHQWTANDLVLFDNRSVMHSASPVPEKQSFRLLHQIIMCGDRAPAGPAGVGVGNPAVNPNVAAVR